MPDSIQMPMGNRILPGAAAESSRGASSKSENPEKLKHACEEFESIFVNFMLQQMRQSVPQNELFGGGNAEQIYTSMMDGELARSISHQRGLGLANELYRQLMLSASGKENEDSEIG